MAQPAHSHVAPVTPARAGWTGLAIRIVLTLVGAAALVISPFLDWLRSTAAVDINVRSLWRTTFEQRTGNFIMSLGFVFIVLGLVAVVGLAPRSGWLTRLAGVLGIAALVLFVIEVYRADRTVSDLGPGTWIALVGSLVALVGGFLGTRPAVVAAAPAAPATVVES